MRAAAFAIIVTAACGGRPPVAPPPPPPAPPLACGPTTDGARVPPPPAPVASTCGSTTATLADGRVLAVGPHCAELFSAGAWHPAAAPPVAVSDATLTVLADGDVLLVGGKLDEAVHDVQRFNISTGSWRAVAPLNARRFAHAAVRLRDGRVLVTGGCDEAVEGCAGEGRVGSFELYDPRADHWQLSPLPPGAARTGHALVELADGRVLSVGGSQKDSLELPPSSVWDGHQWCDAPPLLAFRDEAHAELRADGSSVNVWGPPEGRGPVAEVYRLPKECPTACRM